MMDFRDFMLDFRKIAWEIQNKITILVENPRQKSWKIGLEIQHKSLTTKLEFLRGL